MSKNRPVRFSWYLGTAILVVVIIAVLEVQERYYHSEPGLLETLTIAAVAAVHLTLMYLALRSQE